MSTEHSREKTPKGNLTQERILDTAAACFLQEGYRDARMTQIAARSGLSRAAIYKHFATKEAILFALNERVLQDALATTRFILNSREPALAVIEKWLRDYLGDETPGGFIRVVMIEDAQGVLMLDQQATEDALKKVKRALTKVIRRGIEEGDIAAHVKPGDTAHMLQGLVFSIKRNNLSARSVVDLRDARHIDNLIATIIAGLRAPS